MDSVDSDIVKFAKMGGEDEENRGVGGEAVIQSWLVAGCWPFTMERSRATLQAACLVWGITQA